MNLIQDKKAGDVVLDNIEPGKKKQRSKRGFKEDAAESTYEAGE